MFRAIRATLIPATRPPARASHRWPGRPPPPDAPRAPKAVHRLNWACANGHLGEVLARLPAVTAADVRATDCSALAEACANGHFAIAARVAAAFGLTADDARRHALPLVCRAGNPRRVRWLAAHFDLDPGDVQKAVDAAARGCAGPHLREWAHWRAGDQGARR